MRAVLPCLGSELHTRGWPIWPPPRCVWDRACRAAVSGTVASREDGAALCFPPEAVSLSVWLPDSLRATVPDRLPGAIARSRDRAGDPCVDATDRWRECLSGLRCECGPQCAAAAYGVVADSLGRYPAGARIQLVGAHCACLTKLIASIGCCATARSTASKDLASGT